MNDAEYQNMLPMPSPHKVVCQQAIQETQCLVYSDSQLRAQFEALYEVPWLLAAARARLISVGPLLYHSESAKNSSYKQLWGDSTDMDCRKRGYLYITSTRVTTYSTPDPEG